MYTKMYMYAKKYRIVPNDIISEYRTVSEYTVPSLPEYTKYTRTKSWSTTKPNTDLLKWNI